MKYALKTVPATVGLKIAAQLTHMKARHAARANDLSAAQLLTNAVLSSHGIVPLSAAGYHAFAMKIWKMRRSTSNPALLAGATGLRTRPSVAA